MVISYDSSFTGPKTFLVCILKTKNAKKTYRVLYHRHCHYHCQLLLHQTHGLLRIISKYDLINPYKSCTFTTLCTLGINSES